ncbi:uncharacterized protein [Apostichopus japonicus]|uniref:uncharacterized protein isoform X1 n=1 Tax=Stichopus japonicus TaxID=307972 RepID=UPI003AB83E26
MDSMKLENILSTFLLCAVITTCLEPSSPRRMTTKFDDIAIPINVLKNETVEFICKQNANNPFNIRFKDIVVVQNKQVINKFSNIFDFQIIGLTTGNLTLKHATEEYKGTYKCGEGVDEKYAVIGDVYTLISSKPICKSSIEIGPYIFEDQIDLIEMNCTSEDGIPQVTISNHIIQGTKTTDVTSISTKTTSSHPHPSKTLSFSPNFNSSFNSSVFVCNVSQQLPAPYQSYQGSCSFGPILFLPLFSVAVTPSEIICSKVKNHIFKCTSNVSEVNLSWTKIPTHWKYDIKESDASIELTVLDTGSDVCSVNIQCVGNYRNRNIISMIEISATNNPGRVIAVLLVVMVICFCLICLIVIIVYKYRLNVSAGENPSTNNAKDRNTSMNDDIVPTNESQIDNSNALNIPTDNYTNINSTLFTYDNGGYLSPCEHLQEYEQYDIVN